MSSQEREFNVADCHVNDVRLVSIKAEAHEYEASYESIRVEFELGDFRIKENESGMRVRAKAETVLYADGEEDRVLATVALLYEVDLWTSDDLQTVLGSDELRHEIIDTRVVPYLFPYVRQKIHELTAELSLPPILVPTDSFQDVKPQ